MSTLKNLTKKQAPRITRELKLGKFHPDFEGDVMQVWVNLPISMKDKYAAIQVKVREMGRAFSPYGEVLKQTNDPEEIERINAEIEKLNEEMRAVNDEVFAWYAAVWGDTAEQVREFSEYCHDNGLEKLWEFVKGETWTLIVMYLEGFEKN